MRQMQAQDEAKIRTELIRQLSQSSLQNTPMWTGPYAQSQPGTVTTTSATLEKENRDLRSQVQSLQVALKSSNELIDNLRTMLAHPDRGTITSIEAMLKDVEGQEVFRAKPPFDYRNLWAAVKTQGHNITSAVDVVMRGGGRVQARIVGMAVAVIEKTKNGDVQTAYYLPVADVDEMNRKQIIADVTAEIIENRVIEQMEKNDGT